MPFAHNDGVDIYYEVHGTGAPLVMLHGFAAKSFQWHFCGYVEPLQQTHRLILIDTRGHGQSGKPHVRQAYRLENRLDDIRAVLRALEIEHAHFMGYSMGGWLAWAMAVRHAAMVDTLIVGGAHPYAESAAPLQGVDGSDPEAFIHALEQYVGEPVSAHTRAIILQNDLAALAAAAVDREGFARELQKISAPVLLFCGELDQRRQLMQQATAQLKGPELLIVPRATHATGLFAGKALLPEMTKFLDGAGTA
jgi:pimeloyl-ACP methyl ester carboxylesterase